ncbi:MAG: FAD-dependent oxidoreductase [Eubacteriales bacterium]|nr:FAD-dependent oxidoreductase [Eubacteriales bacterium]
MKILIVGGVAGGASVAARLRRLDHEAQIIVFERGEHPSFSNCCLPYFLSRQVPESERLILMTPEIFDKRYGIEVRVRQEVTGIDRAGKIVRVKNLNTGESYEETYDKLVLSPGAAPIMPASIAGIDAEHVFGIRNVTDIRALDEYVSRPEVRHIAVVGGGFIGIEAAENLIEAGKEVTLIEAADQILAPFDADMVQLLHKTLDDNGVHLILNDGVDAIEDKKIILASGTEVAADAVVMAIGVRPETGLAEAAGLPIGETGAIRVDHNYRTADPFIYAVGDAVELHHAITGQPTRLALAGPAQKQARAVADHICGRPVEQPGVIGSSAIRVFGMNAAATGLNERAAQKAGLRYDYALTVAQDKVGLMPGAAQMFLKLIFEVPTGRILGAQAIGPGAVDKRIDVIATSIHFKASLAEMKELELCYSPVFSTAKDVVNHAVLIGLNLLRDEYRQVPASTAREAVESGACIIDVREPGEFKRVHLKGAVNIPMSTYRERLDEFPKDRPVYIHCGSGVRSYNVYRRLAAAGYEHVRDIKGSMSFLRLYEAWRTKHCGLPSIFEMSK